jgi:hypothetical protein
MLPDHLAGDIDQHSRRLLLGRPDMRAASGPGGNDEWTVVLVTGS